LDSFKFKLARVRSTPDILWRPNQSLCQVFRAICNWKSTKGIIPWRKIAQNRFTNSLRTICKSSWRLVFRASPNCYTHFFRFSSTVPIFLLVVAFCWSSLDLFVQKFHFFLFLWYSSMVFSFLFALSLFSRLHTCLCLFTCYLASFGYPLFVYLGVLI
jgi:hypothetical protein